MRNLWIFCIIAAASLLTNGCQTNYGKDPETTKVLVIGNDFSVTVLRNLPRFAKSAKVPLDLAVMTIDESTLTNHVANLRRKDEDRKDEYRLIRLVRGRRVTDTTKADLVETLDIAPWDAIVLQQHYDNAARENVDSAIFKRFVVEIRSHAPHAKIYFQEPWAPTPWDANLKASGLTQGAIQRRLAESTRKIAKECGAIVIPTGEAVAQWRRRLPVKYGERSYGGDVVGGCYQDERDQFIRQLDNTWAPNGDVSHLNEDGEYLQSMLWASVLLKIKPKDVGERPKALTKERVELMGEIVTELGRSH